MDDRWYICAKTDSLWGAVDEEGRPSSLLPLQYKKIRSPRYFDKKDPWFNFWDFNDQEGFVNGRGETKFVRPEVSPPLSINRFIEDDWHLYAIQIAGKTGIIDLHTMDWFISPFEGKLRAFKCTFKGDVNKPPRFLTDQVIDLYIGISKEEEGKVYYVGKGDVVYLVE